MSPRFIDYPALTAALVLLLAAWPLFATGQLAEPRLPSAPQSNNSVRDRQFGSLIEVTKPSDEISVIVMIRVGIPRTPDGVAQESLQASTDRAMTQFVGQLRKAIGDQEFEKLPAPQPIRGMPAVVLKVLGSHLPMLRDLPEVISIEPVVRLLPQ